jgi:cytidine deaminase
VNVLDTEDQKLVQLARSARARLAAAEGAAVRDTTGRTYVATTVQLPSLRLTAVQAAVVMAVCGGADGLEAVALVSDSGTPPAGQDLAAVRDLGGPATAVIVAASDGTVRTTLEAG